MEMQPKDYAEQGPVSFEVHDVKGIAIADRCVWCGEVGGMSESHLFPRLVGGRCWSRITCASCNSYLGSQVDEKLYDNVVVAAGLVTKGLKSPQRAYQKARIIDIDTGMEFVLKRDKAEVVPSPLPDGGFRGPMIDIARYWTKRLREQGVDIDGEKLHQDLRAPVSNEVRYAGGKIVKTVYPQNKRDFRVDGLRTDVNDKLLFKIVYEFMAGVGLLGNLSLLNALTGQFRVQSNSRDERVQFRDDLKERVLDTTACLTQGCEEYQKLDFQDFHMVCLRLTPSGILYAAVSFFFKTWSMYIVSHYEGRDPYLNLWLDRCFIVSIRKTDSCHQTAFWPHLQHAEWYRKDNALVDERVAWLASHGHVMSVV